MKMYELGLDASVDETILQMISELNENTRCYKEMLIELIRVFYEIQESGSVSSLQLAMVEAAMMTSWEYTNFHWSGKYAMWLSNDFEEVENFLLRLWKTGNGTTRQKLVSFLDANPSEKVANTILTAALSDRAKWVRGSAIGIISKLGYKQYLPLLSERCKVEKDATIRAAIENCIDIITLGYRLQPQAGGMTMIYYKKPQGTIMLMVYEDELEYFVTDSYVQKINNGEPFFMPENAVKTRKLSIGS